jgi:uncharacterized membrane protein
VSDLDETPSSSSPPEHSPVRLLALTDGVFAIAMTLLALDVRFPESVPETSAGFAGAAGAFFGRFGVFFVAFLITSRFWLTSHRHLARLRRTDDGVLRRSVLFLFGICSLPVATSVLFRFGGVPWAVAFAAGVLALTAALSARLWWYLSSPARDLADVPRGERDATLVRQVLVVVAYALAAPLAFVLPDGRTGYATLVWALLAVVDPVTARVHPALVRRRVRRDARA